MIDSKIKNFNEFEKVNEAYNQNYMPNYYECYMITFTAYEDSYEEGENSKAYTYENIEENIKAATLDELLKTVSRDYSHWIIEPIDKQNSYYESPYICCAFGPVNNHWTKLSKSEEAAWKEGSFTAYATYVNVYIRKCTEVPNAEAFKFVGKP